MDLIAYLVQLGLERPTAALTVLLAAFCALLLPGIALVAYKEGWRAPTACPTPRGATRHNPGQP